MQGRGTGTAGGDRAAEYIADRLRAYGLQPLHRDSYFQEVPMHGSRPLPEGRMQLMSGDVAKELKLGRDYLLYRTGDQTFVSTPLPLVFVGFGIVAPEFDHNDYQNVDVAGKIVVFLDGEPASTDADYFDGPRPTSHSVPHHKQRVALARGARGSILIPRHRDPQEWTRKVQEFSFEHVTLAYHPSGHLAMVMNPASAHYLFARSPVDFDRVLQDAAGNTMDSFALGVELSFQGRFQERDFMAVNVLGWIKGGDPGLRDSYLLISAHYDHLGVGVSVRGIPSTTAPWTMPRA